MGSLGNISAEDQHELSLLNMYIASLQNLMKIDKELSTLRKSSTSKINSLIRKSNDTVVQSDGPNESVTPTDRTGDEKSLNESKATKTIHPTDLDFSNLSSHLKNVIKSGEPDAENASLNLAQYMIGLYSKLINQYLRDEKLLSKYFDAMQTMKENSALNMAKQKLLRLKTENGVSGDSSPSVRRKQRALLLRLQHEYNEIKFMQSVKRKLSSDRRKSLYRQLRAFRNMFSAEAGAGRPQPTHRRIAVADRQRSPVKCYDTFTLEQGDAERVHVRLQECYLLLNGYREKLDGLLRLYADLRLNAAGIESIDGNDDVSETLSTLSRLSKMREYARRVGADRSTCESSRRGDKAEEPKTVIDKRVVLFDADVVGDTPIQQKPPINVRPSSLNLSGPKEKRAMVFYAPRPADAGYNLTVRMSRTDAWKLILDDAFRTNAAPTSRADKNTVSLFAYFQSPRSDRVSALRVDFVCAFERLLHVCDTSQKHRQSGSDKSVCFLRCLAACLFGNCRFRRRRAADDSTDDTFEKFKGTLSCRLLQLQKEFNDEKYTESLRRYFDKLVNRLDGESTSKSFHKPLRESPDCSISNKESYVYDKASEESDRDLETTIELVDEENNADIKDKIPPAKSFQIEEAEELRKKQLAVELEIKALLEQQTAQLPYFVMREIPDKPPPPYIPPSEDVKVSTGTCTDLVPLAAAAAAATPRCDQIRRTVRFCYDNIWSPYLTGRRCDEREAAVIFRNKCVFYQHTRENPFLFDLCNELFVVEYKEADGGRRPRPLASDVCRTVERLVHRHLDPEAAPCRENIFINCAHKVQDHVDELLIKELQDEEPEWVDVEQYEGIIKRSVSDYIFDALIADTINELKSIYGNE